VIRELGKRRKKQKHGRRESLEGRLEQAKKKGEIESKEEEELQKKPSLKLLEIVRYEQHHFSTYS
jgi:hypothetical protein